MYYDYPYYRRRNRYRYDDYCYDGFGRYYDDYCYDGRWSRYHRYRDRYYYDRY